ncbi:MAG: tetratricopeptide repeat protein [Eubacteriales bacterium]|nr:tetratricopeptide repeat protein [Eubacteriales bacterium]
MSTVEEKARQISGMYYNQGLDCAKIRDLSGAEDRLRLSLQFDKTNIQARNLLGLVYYELGEGVAALREWVLSENMHPANNPASAYIADIRREKKRLQQMNDAIHQYNEALRSCREGNEDIAAIRLRRLLNKNPRLIKAYQLLALIEIKQGRYSHARRMLKKAIRIDRTNPITLRYLQEIDERTDTTTSFEFRVKDNRKRGRAADDENIDGNTGAPRISSAAAFRDTPHYVTMMNMLFGFLVGVLLLGFIVVPAVRRSTSRTANEKIVDYTSQLADQTGTINQLRDKLDTANNTASDAQNLAETNEKAKDSYDSLIQAYMCHQRGELEKAGDLILKVDISLLSTAAAEIYDTYKDEILNSAYDEYLFGGNNAFFEKKWEKAAEYYEKALLVKPDDYDTLTLLVEAYENAKNNEKAIEIYQKIYDTYPNSRRSEEAAASIARLGGTLKEKTADDSTVPNRSEEAASRNAENTEEENSTEDTASDETTSGETVSDTGVYEDTGNYETTEDTTDYNTDYTTDYTDLDGDGIPDDEGAY